ncbi:hypothetical protein EXIGLDRAFT_83795 [Exidia glandulosa HHB12029]|uniref:Secreted protein n=1 Tax=Exidia glandulosa HHB12029 TaxID=1314781 RepID=A0A165HJV7_EXIGL|nr:hypothetical protein EXIGLDRAFT_83795 [Exidia glandulosa HHB12029]
MALARRLVYALSLSSSSSSATVQACVCVPLTMMSRGKEFQPPIFASCSHPLRWSFSIWTLSSSSRRWGLCSGSHICPHVLHKLPGSLQPHDHPRTTRCLHIL